MNDIIKEKLAGLTPVQREQLRMRRQQKASELAAVTPGSAAQLDYSLFFFSAVDEAGAANKYDMLIQCAEFADQNGFKSLWLPERHFTPFGGLYPNPSVLAAALATRTRHLELRAGSVVVPLHNPARIVEEWSVVDNLSNGRVALALASGWHKKDFALHPEAWEDRRERVASGIMQIRKLWRGEAVTMPGGDGELVSVSTWPRPVQEELRLWLTCSSAQGWTRAGELGANVLCMMGHSPALLEENIQRYRQAREAAGYQADDGIITVMLHTYLDNDMQRAKTLVREPMLHYLEEYLRQFDSLVDSDMRKNVESNKAQFLEFAFERYFEQAALFGSVDKCRALTHSLAQMGVKEIACLIDFGVPTERVMNSLSLLKSLFPRS